MQTLCINKSADTTQKRPALKHRVIIRETDLVRVFNVKVFSGEKWQPCVLSYLSIKTKYESNGGLLYEQCC